ncbi:hypothetical protein F5887DRAFT_378307 [Amanita rubescens]|nr:hypothetical protein F5887DRAFT_378307 [Amanita rubescens]
MNQMDVDPTTRLPSSSSKRPADFLPASSSADKRTKILPPDGQLTKLNSNMGNRMYNILVDVAEANESVWWNILSSVLMDLTLELASTDMKDSVIANLNRERADDIVKSFNNKDQLEEWKVDVRNAVKSKDWTDLVLRPELKIPTIASTFELSPEQENATKISWERPYHGRAAEALWTHIRKHYRPDDTTASYVHFCSVVQSSGTGKSRTVDELGKKHFSIPINLRDAKFTGGYPPADHEVRDFLTKKGTEGESYRRACRFIDALFQHTDHILKKEFDPKLKIEEVACKFRMRMTEGQTMTMHNEFRRQFYQQVVQIAKGKLTAAQPGSDTGPAYISPSTSENAIDDSPSTSKNTIDDSPSTSEDAIDDNSSQHYAFPAAASCNKLVRSLRDRKPWSSSCQNYPLVILTFDEAHTLANREETTWSNLSVLRHVFRALYRFPLFALFLSTTGRIWQFTSPDEDTSTRIFLRNLKLIQPFIDLGFDMLAKKVALNGKWDLEHVTRDSHIVHMGRPLFGSRWDAGDVPVRANIVTFAVGKLLNANPSTEYFTEDQMLACLSQRLPIKFNSTTYISHAERKQVEGHMRVCLNIDDGFQSMTTVSPSEPLLSEAAYVIMSRKSFDVLKCFKTVLDGFAVHKGDRGEFLALLLLTLARDKAVGPPDDEGRPKCHPKQRYFDFASFMYGHLFKSLSNPVLVSLQHDFPNAKMHFNHFVKLHDFKSVDKECLLHLMTRGAGVLCANNHASIDAVTVFLKSGTKLTTNNIGLGLHQFKNDPSYSKNPQPELFESMDPYECGILKEGDAAVPIVKIVFALAARSAGLHVTRHDPSEAYNAVVYDIWCAGLSPEYLEPICEEQTDIWDGLLQASNGWKKIYKAAADIDLRRSMYPGATFDGGHWSNWNV